MGTREYRILNFRSVVVPSGTVIKSATFVVKPPTVDSYYEGEPQIRVPNELIDEINRVMKQMWSDETAITLVIKT